MKEIRKEKVSYYDVFVATDGTEFNDKSECEKYEKSALCAIETRYRGLVIKSISEADTFFGAGSEELRVELVRLEKPEDVDLVMQMYFVHHSYLTPAECEERKVFDIANRAFDENDVLFIGRGYENDDFWFYGTKNSMKESIDKL